MARLLRCRGSTEEFTYKKKKHNTQQVAPPSHLLLREEEEVSPAPAPRVFSCSSTITMRITAGKHLLCLVLLTFPLSWAVYTKKDAKTTENDTAAWSQSKARRLFARRKIVLQKERHVSNIQTNPMTPARRCSRLMESCSGRTPCCDPCASCRCRLFNTICHCWRSNPLCLKRT